LPSPISQANKNASLPNDSRLVGEYQGIFEALLREESDLAAGVVDALELLFGAWLMAT
jgi:hypothetical protein